MRKLALKNASFARDSIDYFVDMLIDDLDTVRGNAMNSLNALADHLQLQVNEEQLKSILSNLDDSRKAMRHGVRSFLGYVQKMSRLRVTWSAFHCRRKMHQGSF
jgi:hypothetical protein